MRGITYSETLTIKGSPPSLKTCKSGFFKILLYDLAFSDLLKIFNYLILKAKKELLKTIDKSLILCSNIQQYILMDSHIYDSPTLGEIL